MREAYQIVTIRLDENRYGLPLASVERVVRAVEVTPLPKAPEIVLGVIDVQGRVIPVIDIRRRFRLPERALALTDQFVIARTARRPLALVVDAVTDVVTCAGPDLTGTDGILPGVEYVEGVAKLADGLTLIHDLEKFLSLEEETSLDRALETA